MPDAKNPAVDIYLGGLTKWAAELGKLRDIALGCGLGLDDDLKWGKPCYSFGDGNVAILQPFKDYCALLFVKGALLTDPQYILIQQTTNVQAARQLRFTDAAQIERQAPVIANYVREAVEIEKSGREVEMKKTEDFAVPEEFQNRLGADAKLKTAFEALTPGRRRAYLMHFAQPKQAKTREARIEKCVPQIMAGRGLDE